MCFKFPALFTLVSIFIAAFVTPVYLPAQTPATAVLVPNASKTEVNSGHLYPIASDTVITDKGVLGTTGLKVFLNTGSELIMIQAREMMRNTIQIELADANKELVVKKDFYQGTTICHIVTDTLYNGLYFLTVIKEDGIRQTFKIMLNR